VSSMQRIRCTVESMNYSACGLAVGDSFDIGPAGVCATTGRGMCFYAIASVAAMMGAVPDTEAWLDTQPRVACPDPPENLVLRIERA
jgi:uncharacterized repeat protein (TIGR04076 family)